MKHNVTHNVRLVNPFTQDSSIKQDAVIGSAEAFESVENIVPVEHETDKDNFLSVRRIQTMKPENSRNIDVRDKVRRVKEANRNVPEHLKQLYSNASENLNETQSNMVLDTLQKYGEAFSKN